MIKFFKKTEKRASYTDSIVDALVTAVAATPTDASQTAAVEASASMLARAFASAKIEGDSQLTKAITPHFRATIARRLILVGNSIWHIKVAPDGLILTPASQADISGTPDPTKWRYDITLSGPSKSTQIKTNAASVLHFKYAIDPNQPWHGISPLRAAKSSSALAAATDALLRNEMEAGSAYVLPAPLSQLSQADLASLQQDLKAAKGRTALVPSMQSGWSDGTRTAGSSDWTPSRIGGNPPATVVDLFTAAGRAVLAATGTPIQLFDAQTDGTGRREAWRQYLHGTVQPIAALAAQELSEKLNSEISFNFESLFASDIQGRARAFQSMVGGGMDIAAAAANSGLMNEE